MRELVWNKEVTATWRELDRYGRPVAQITSAGVDVNAAQVERGMAWVYTKYARDVRLREWGADARRAKRGLWAAPNPVAPWAWQQGGNEVKRCANRAWAQQSSAPSLS